ncbi:MAG TPA: hypothetical protein VEO54_21345 [Thermoanaerobaculia bacterium]|nr:hypothetical protein [Thermoanaerobaculia bacterium]
MKSLRFALTLVAALVLGAPPSAQADTVCNFYQNRYAGYYADCGCNACGGWASHACTECVDTETGASCHADGYKLCPMKRIPM